MITCIEVLLIRLLSFIYVEIVMGHIEVEVGVGDLEGGKIMRTKALVDTGATLTIIPEDLANRLGLKRVGEKVKVVTASGFEELELSHALIEIGSKRRITPVLISNKIDRVIIGVVTLEAMQLRVNPVTEKLEEFTALFY
ncbi:MAG: retroviral-like aspartic protease family protein [Desulfurococcaceae archaeon]|nr:retroviral-like aspartic protease family protein [Desulfurococcaceae archaeon]